MNEILCLFFYSLFLVRGTKDNRYLCSRLFDVTENSTVEDATHTEEEEIRIPFGHGIAGHVAKFKESINIKNAYEVCINPPHSPTTPHF